MTKWSSWTCNEHKQWFGPTWITDKVVECIQQNCRVEVFTSRHSSNNYGVQVVLFNPNFQWVMNWDD